jgi:ubiquinone/menaquinone biosynthesis C-methylase UbiE
MPERPSELPDSRRRSAPESDRFYSDPDIASRYDRSRALSPETVEVWRELIEARVPPARTRRVVDLGCGTGRFTMTLAELYGGPVLAVDASAPMLEGARRSAAATGLPIHFVRASGEALPLPDRWGDLFFLSMVFHHFPDPGRALREIRRSLRRGGALLIRTCTLEALDTYVYQRFFPGARRFDEQRFPPRQQVVASVEREGFALAIAETVRQEVAANLAEYVERNRLRAHSDLQAISDEEYAEGFARFEAYAREHGGATSGSVLEEVDVFTFEAV